MPYAALQTFFRTESGAVTVDWTVLTAGIVGMGVASTAAVSTGTSSLGQAIQTALSNASVAMMGTVNAVTNGFDSGDFTGWSSARLGYSEELGEFLGPFAGYDEPVTHQVSLPEGATEATISFDLLLLDSWDGTSTIHSDARFGGRGDGIAFTVDGVEIGFSAMTNGTAFAPTGSFEANGTTYEYSLTRAEGGDFGYSGWQDARYSVSITATNPPAEGFTLGVNGTSNQGLTDESFGIDNFRVDAVTP